VEIQRQIGILIIIGSVLLGLTSIDLKEEYSENMNYNKNAVLAVGAASMFVFALFQFTRNYKTDIQKENS